MAGCLNRIASTNGAHTYNGILRRVKYSMSVRPRHEQVGGRDDLHVSAGEVNAV